MAVIINASTSTGLVQSADTSGIIQFQSNGSTKATLSSSGFSYPGGVLQVVQTVKTDFFSTSSNSATDITGLSASITPSSTSNRILILANISYTNSLYTNGGFWACYFWVTDGSNNVLGQANADGARQRVSMGGHSFYEAGDLLQKQFTFLWSPNSTSAQTVKIRTAASTGADVVVNKSYNENNVGTPGGNYTAISQITLMEISA